MDINIYAEVTGVESAAGINMELAKAYLEQLEVLSRETDTSGDLIAAVMRMPDVIGVKKMSSVKRNGVFKGFNCGSSRKTGAFSCTRGSSIAEDFELRLIEIEKSMKEIEPHEQQRLLAVRERLLKGLDGVEIDSNRYEQEVIFYIEKLDINEEKVRLANHLKYFRETMNEKNSGKKLGFIAQEIGREINTLGSKSNYAPIQQHVIQMKDEHQKIKEQVGNTL